MTRTPWLLLALFTASATAQEHSYEHLESGWVRRSASHTFAVDPRIVTVGGSLALDVAGILSGLEGPLAGIRMIRENHLGFRDLLLPEGSDVMELVAELRRSGHFDSVEENTHGVFTGGSCATSITPTFADQWSLENTGQTGGFVDADIDAPEAWMLEDGDPMIVVAMVDSGTNWNHEDLVGNIWTNSAEALDGSDTDGNGFVDDVRGWDFEADDNDPNGIFWHGTATAGVVAARGQNGLGIEGVAGGANDGVGVSIMPLKVGNFTPLTDALDDAILYAVDNGADIINLSLGVGVSSAVSAALDYAEANGVFVVAATGDDFSGPIHYPANYPSVMAVTSSTHIDIVSNISNLGVEVDVTAPGELIPVCHLGNSDYFLACGSSFAAPHVAGLAALLLSIKESMTNAELYQYITENADDVEQPGEDVFSGAGRINANKALTELTTGFAKVYGVGTAGSFSIPGIVASGVPTIGETLVMTTFNGLPGAISVLAFSTQSALIPFLGGFLNVHPAGMLFFATTIDMNGDGARSFPLPNDTALIANERFMQWFIVDAAGPGGLSMSRGMHVRVQAP